MSHLVRVHAPSRLHFGLLALGAPAQRQFGGVGVMVDAPGLTISFRARPAGAGERFTAVGPLAERALAFARRFAEHGFENAAGDALGCQIEIESAPPEHVGLGTGTQLGLAVAAGLDRLAAGGAGGQRATDDEATPWAARIGRGERSAIGTHGFARGGLLVEGGKPAGGGVSALVSRVELPETWRFVLLVDGEKRGLSGAEERRAFAELPPSQPDITAALCREVLIDLLPAALEGDFEAFGESVYRYGHASGLLFAERQGGAYAAGRETELVAWLGSRGVRGVGQSSWGPTIFALCRDSAEAATLAADATDHFAGLTATVAAPANHGARIEFE
ncbi:MAG TPA: hypothetical protein VMF30_13170 [Pirellulales bacterium]|nr:hypothetical protein [Pirellulales bacterium]